MSQVDARPSSRGALRAQDPAMEILLLVILLTVLAVLAQFGPDTRGFDTGRLAA